MTEMGGKRSVVAAVEVTGAGVILHDQSAAVRNVIEQPAVVRAHIITGVIGANASHNGAISVQVAAGELLRRD